MDPEFWNNRYAAPGFTYGTDPNAFVVACAPHLPAGPVLCLGEGEGRNALYLAQRGHEVTAVDQSAVGLAKARERAARAGLTINTVVADLGAYGITPGAWSGIVATFVHLPPALRARVHHAAAAGLRPGGCLILEAYTPDQLRHRTGGPVNQPECFMTLAALREEFAGLDLRIARELERDVREGTGHTGRGAVVQILAVRPGSNEDLRNPSTPS
ncbi:MAG: methyltransferase domain-containing protein [Verrucomicrobia bacterium]|nr:methyltransferase domain-containing protein [Verrucomicrobiota bacterium]